jgi:pyrroloquinoline quinone biosynthesis protein B
MRARVLGSAAGGGFPQWNCRCAQCQGVRAGTLAARPRTQASLAVSSDGDRWLLVGASPDVRSQLGAAPELAPRREGSPIAAVALPNGDVDAWAGLLSLREWTPLEVFATSVVRADVAGDNGALRTLERFPGQSRWIDLVPGARVAAVGELSIEAVPVAGQPPLHQRGWRSADQLDNVGFVIRDERRKSALGWFPSVAAPSHALVRALAEVDALFFDGTFLHDDELLRAGRGSAGAREIGHWPVGGEDGSAAFVAAQPARDKWLVHVNNTNPLLVEDGPERAWLRSLGIDVAEDGLTWER